LVYKPEDLRVIIPVGGLAKRLMPLTAETSKALIRLVNMPLIEIAMLGLAKQGVKHFIFGVKGYRNFLFSKVAILFAWISTPGILLSLKVEPFLI